MVGVTIGVLVASGMSNDDDSAERTVPQRQPLVSAVATSLPERESLATPATERERAAAPDGRTEEVGADEFFEDFSDGQAALARFRYALENREGTSGNDVTADHADHEDGDCGPPTTPRALSGDHNFVFVCASVGGDSSKAHLMTAVGHVSAYSIGWFSPRETFTDATTVEWDVNVTDLHRRQWWEVMVVPVDGPEATCIEWLPCGAETRSYPEEAVVVGNGPFGSGRPMFTAGGSSSSLTVAGQDMCALDPEGCASKAIRRRWSMNDNGNGTITIRFDRGTDVLEWSMSGSFPDEPWKVVFKDHNYTPDKDGVPVGYTWHWDNIRIH